MEKVWFSIEITFWHMAILLMTRIQNLLSSWRMNDIQKASKPWLATVAQVCLVGLIGIMFGYMLGILKGVLQ